MASLVLYGSLSLLVYILYKRITTKRRPAPYPPSPPADPIVGHARFLPPSNQPEYFDKLRSTYGDILYFNVLGKHLVVLNSQEDASELLDKKSAIYSSRPPSVMFVDVLGFELNISMMSLDERGKKHRSMMTAPFTRAAIRNYLDIQMRETNIFIQNVMQKPQDFDWYLRMLLTAVIVEIIYGRRITDDNDPYIIRADNVSTALANAGTPGGAPPDMFPFLRHIPGWVPGAWWSRYGAEHRPKVREFFDVPVEEVQKQMKEGTAKPSYVYTHLEDPEKVTTDHIEDIKGSAGTIYAAGAETTWSTIRVFLYYLIKHPEYQTLAQEEMDKVVGSGRLPDLQDQESLPFLECMLQETMRINPVVPLGLPHESTEDHIYRGYFIPKGTMVLANIYSIQRDPAIYKDPTTFNPKRYLPQPEGNGEPFPTASFGFGRRICTGRHFAYQQLWLVASHILATLNIHAHIGADGKAEELDPEFPSQLFCYPKPFKCSITSRSPRAERLISDALANID